MYGYNQSTIAYTQTLTLLLPLPLPHLFFMYKLTVAIDVSIIEDVWEWVSLGAGNGLLSPCQFLRDVRNTIIYQCDLVCIPYGESAFPVK